MASYKCCNTVLCMDIQVLCLAGRNTVLCHVVGCREWHHTSVVFGRTQYCALPCGRVCAHCHALPCGRV